MPSPESSSKHNESRVITKEARKYLPLIWFFANFFPSLLVVLKENFEIDDMFSNPKQFIKKYFVSK